MRIQILILIFAVFVCACQVPQQAQINEASNKINLNLETVANLSENKPLKAEKPKPVDDSKFSSVRIEKTIQKPKFSINVNVEYPKLKNVKTSPEIKFNQYVKNKLTSKS